MEFLMFSLVSKSLLSGKLFKYSFKKRFLTSDSNRDRNDNQHFMFFVGVWLAAKPSTKHLHYKNL